MKIITDFQIHSRFARATSKQINLDNLEKWARVKGIDLLGTGDFQHPLWFKEINEKLEEDENGILWSKTKFPFFWQTEISLIYTQDGKGRRVHHLILAPNKDVASQIIEALAKKGRLDYDGRPIFGFSSIELVDMMMSITKDIEIIPAHCLVQGTFIHTNPGLKQIENVQINDKVLTHKGNFKEVKKLYKRPYKGEVFKVIPWYFSEGVTVTPEHPFFAIKTDKNCSWTQGLICKPTESHKRICFTESYKNYKKTWISAKDLEVGDVVIYPKLKDIEDKVTINENDLILFINNDFCRLVGYYLAEGYTNGRDAFCFTFNVTETDLIEDVRSIVKNIFNIEAKKGKTDGDLIFYSRSLIKLFQKLFYIDRPYRANNKRLPNWALKLPLEKQKEIFVAWWKGDKGYTVSRILANQMKIICLRLNILPSIRIDTMLNFEKRGKHFISNRKIKAKFDLISLDRLSFLEDKFGLLNYENFKKFKSKKDIRHAWFDEDNIYIPIRKIIINQYDGLVYNLEVQEDNSYVTEAVAVHNCWTPWYSIFGSLSGFDSVEECFKEKSKYIHALETGMSSSPAMNWMISDLDKYTLVSNSDAHSFWPYRLGREANVFDIELNYDSIIKAIRTKEGFIETIEVDPNYGKYHYDGHRNCNFSCDPEETKKLNNICPVCKRQLIIGVLNRVYQLADRKFGFKPKEYIPFKTLIPLSELIATVYNINQVYSKKVWHYYNKLIEAFGNEFNVLLDIQLDDLKKVIDEKLSNYIILNRDEKLTIKPGFDGEYGRLIFDDKKIKENKVNKKQTSLTDF